MRIKNYIEEIVAGLLILAVGLGALGWGLRPLVFPLAPLAMVGINVFAIVEFFWIAILAGLIAFGILRNKPGLILAPFIFHLCWFGASVASHRALLASLDPKVWSAPISEEARSQRTLIANSYQIVDRKIIADGHVDRLFKVKHDGSTHKIINIEEISSAKGEECSLEEKQASPQLRNAGRTDECFKSRDLTAIPDGLVIEKIERRERGCCAETQARLRTGGEERLLFSWFQGFDYALEPFPRFYWLGGPFMETVRFGLADIEPITMESAVYGVAPPYPMDIERTRPALSLSAEDAADRAQSLAKLTNVSPRAVVSLLTKARAKGTADERSLEVAASLVGHDAEGWLAVLDYANDLNSEQTNALFQKILQRLETPDICSDCIGARLNSNYWKLLRDRLSHPDEFAERAKRIFAERSDLAAWQYEGSLLIMKALGPSYPASENFVQGPILSMLLADDTTAYSDKAIAYLIVAAKGFQSTQVWPTAASKLDLVHDQDLKQYISGFWGLYLTSLVARNASKEQLLQAARICERISRISDPGLRGQKFAVDCSPDPAYHGR
jgi:hypothetical protein